VGSRGCPGSETCETGARVSAKNSSDMGVTVTGGYGSMIRIALLSGQPDISVGGATANSCNMSPEWLYTSVT
jgi:hypothetical protein